MDKPFEKSDFSEVSLPASSLAPSPPYGLSSKEDLHRFARETLRLWIGKLEAGGIPIRIPKMRGLMKLNPGTTFHLHPELFLQLSGITVFTFPEETLEVGPGEICLVPRGLPHTERVRGWRGAFANLVFMYSRETFFHLAHEQPRGRPAGLLGSHLPARLAFVTLLDEACELAHSGNSEWAAGVKGLLVAHLALLLGAMEGASSAVPTEPFKVTQARQWVIQHLADPDLSVAGLARQLQCSADYLSQLFRKTTGSTLQGYINRQRLARAHELLEMSSLNVAEVSQAAGFRDPGYFSRAFRRWAGVSPKEVRRGARREQAG